MNFLDFEQLKGHQQELLHIANSLEAIRERNKGRGLLGLLRVIAEMHDHQAKLMDITESNFLRTEIRIGCGSTDSESAVSNVGAEDSVAGDSTGWRGTGKLR